MLALLRQQLFARYMKILITYKYYLDLEDKNVLYESENPRTKIPFYTPFVEQRKDIDRSSALYSIKAPFELVHAEVAGVRFFSKSTVDSKYYLLAVDLFTSKTYVYSMKNRNLLARKLELFYRHIQPKREKIAKNGKVRLQTDLEIKKLNKIHKIGMFSGCVCEGKAYAAEQKIREFKKLIFQSKRLHKATSAKHFDSRKLIRKAAQNMNSINSHKYGYVLNATEEKAVERERFRDIYDFYRLVKVKQHAEKYERVDVAKDKKLRRKLREPFI